MRGALHGFGVHTVLHHTGPQPQANQPEDTRIGDPKFEHPYQPRVVHAAEKVADVDIDDPIDTLADDRRRDHPQRIMGATSRAETERVVMEVSLIDGAQQLGRRALDDLVLEREQAKRPLPPIGFRNVGSQHRHRPILVRLETGMERAEIALQVPLVVRHRHSVHAGRRLPPQPPERSFERRDVEMVELRREAGLARLRGRLVHPDEMRVQGFPTLRLDLPVLAEAKADLAAWLSKWSARYPRLTTWVEETIEYTLTFFRLPRQHHKHRKSTNMLERLNEEIRRRTNVVRIFPNSQSCLRLVRALAAETNENWMEANRYINMDDLREHKKLALRQAA